MKKKIFLFILLLGLQIQYLFSQCISIELSVTWQMEVDIFNKDSMVNTPVLNITYHNNCDVSYYFFKVSPKKDEKIMIACRALVNYQEPDSLLKNAKIHGNYANQNFNVTIKNNPLGGGYWWIERDSADDISHRYIHISCCLDRIYRYLYSEKRNNTERKKPAHLVQTNTRIDEYLYYNEEPFVFLKPDKIHVDTYNLIGYKIVEGCFTFFTEQNRIENYVLGTEYDPKKKKTFIKKYELPPVVDEYQLYSGGFNTNKVTVCFGEK
jgi:hypothetical protein